MKIYNSFFLKVFEKFGEEHQINKMQEECLELALALSRRKCQTKKKDESEIYSELADVKIMLAQMEIIYSKEKINKMIDYKIERLKRYL